jgi:aminopeptidase-like protein
VLKYHVKDFTEYSFLDRGSDERQYCSPGIDLPMASIMRTKYGEYQQYHTSLDDLNFISDKGLNGAFEVLALSIICIENNLIYKPTNLCEPQLGRYNLRNNLSTGNKLKNFGRDVVDVLAYSDGKKDLLSIAIEIKRPLWKLIPTVDKLVKTKLLIRV